MPSYPGVANSATVVPSNLSPISLSLPGDSCFLFGTLKAGATQLPITDTTVSGETPAAGQASIAICLAAGDNQPAPMVSLEGIFSGAPGTFEVDVQEADTDADAFYITPAAPAYTITALGNSTSNSFRVDLQPTGGKFMRAKLVSRANNVTLILKASRLA